MTTDAKRPRIHPFSRGEVRAIHEIGRYTIVEFVFTYPNDCADRKKGDKEIEFACYVDDRDLGERADTLEDAILICIANRNGKPDRAAYYAAKLLDLHDD